MRCIKAFVLSAVLFVAPSVFAQAVGTHAAGSPGSRFYSQTFTTVGANTFVVPTGVQTIFLTACGAGGGGGGGHTADPGGGGGGGGGAVCTYRMPIQVTPGSSLTITVGTAGLGGAAGAAGGVVNVNTTIAGLPIGTMTILGASASGTGTATNGGAGGGVSVWAGQGVTGTGTGANNSIVTPRVSGGDIQVSEGGAAGGGPSSNGGVALSISGYSPANMAGAVASGTKGGGGPGGSSSKGVGGAGGSNAVGDACTVGYGAGGGGGSAGNFAGGNGCQGFATVEWWN